MATVNYLVCGLVIVASCGFPTLPQLGGDAAGAHDGGVDATIDAAAGVYQLVAIEPAIADEGDTVTLEGTFAAPTIVTFPGGSTQTATLIGDHRATVTVPASATTGLLSATVQGAPAGAVAFRRVTFAPNLGGFQLAYDQASGARQATVLATARAGASSAVIGNHVYVLGGEISTNIDTPDATSIERATINADGTLGAFAIVPEISLASPRDSYAQVMIGNAVYLIGGYTGVLGMLLASVERAPINADGSLGTFAIVPGVTLTQPRLGPSAAVIGNSVYVFGGFDLDGLSSSVERAPVNPDGSLGAFAIVDGVSLIDARAGHSTEVIGGAVYVIGGQGAGNAMLDSVERAPILPDGTLGTFADVTGARLMTGRGGHTSAVIGKSLYVLGGMGAGGSFLSSIEQAAIGSDGSLGAFVVGTEALAVARSGHTSAVVGNELYVFGGVTVGANPPPTVLINTVEHASIDATGKLATFAQVAGLTLSPGRDQHTSVVVGSTVYVVGGADQFSTLASVEDSAVAADGTLGTFTTNALSLLAARKAATGAAIGGAYYVLGGFGAGYLNSVERAPIDGDGSLGAFAAVSGVTLTVARDGCASVVIGAWLYVIGGESGGTGSTVVERAPIAGDGSLGAFATVPSAALVTGRFHHTIAVIGNWLYVIGGQTTNTDQLGSVERAAVNADGSLGAFSTVAGRSLVTPRTAHTMTVIGSSLYVIGGASAGGLLTTIERAPINSDGSLGAFATAAAVLNGPHSLHTSVVLGSSIYVIGGFGAQMMALTIPYTTFEQAALP